MSDQHELGPLLARVLAGDGQALETLLAKIRPYLHLLVRQNLEVGARQKLDESDVVQETLVLIHRNLDPSVKEAGGRFGGRDAARFLGWVNRIVRNVIIDLERRGRAEIRDQRREVPGSKIFAELAQGSTPEEKLERSERAIQLASAIERLPLHQRDVLKQRVFDALSFEEISRQTGKSEGALRVVVTRAIQSLRADGELRRLMEAG